MEDTIIKIKDENGNIKEAKVINTVNIDNQDYILYYIEKDNEKSDLFASRILTDKDNNTIFEDLKDDNEKSKIVNYIQDMLKN